MQPHPQTTPTSIMAWSNPYKSHIIPYKSHIIPYNPWKNTRTARNFQDPSGSIAHPGGIQHLCRRLLGVLRQPGEAGQGDDPGTGNGPFLKRGILVIQLVKSDTLWFLMGYEWDIYR